MKFEYHNGTITIPELCIISDVVDHDTDLMILAKTIGTDVRYQIEGMKIIDYPGEYELNGCTIEVLSDSEGLLHYSISHDGKTIGYVQNPKIVTNRIFADVTDWLCDNDLVIQSVEKLDESGKIHDVRQNNIES